MTDYDNPWKEALDLYFASFLELLFPEIHAGIDWSRGFEFLDKELMQIMPEAELGKGIVDKLVKVSLPDGTESWLLLHVEVQSQEVANFPLRMFVYNYRIFDRYNRDVVSVAVLGDERASWRPNKYQSERWGCRKEFVFPIVKLLDLLARADELQASSNPIAKVVLAHLFTLQTRQNLDDRRVWKLRLVRSLYERGMSDVEVRRLFRVIDWMMTLPKDLEIQFRADLERLERENHMPYVTSIERLAREEGLEKGLEIVRFILKSRVEKKFGSDGVALSSDIAKITDEELLKRIYLALEGDASLDDVRLLLQSSPA